MNAQSLNPRSLYSSEAVGWQLIMSVLMILQPGKQSKHFGTASLRRPRLWHSWILISEKLGGVNVWRLYWKREQFFQNHKCIHGKTKMNQTNSPKLRCLWVAAEVTRESATPGTETTGSPLFPTKILRSEIKADHNESCFYTEKICSCVPSVAPLAVRVVDHP